jgi:hypothetical protein
MPEITGGSVHAFYLFDVAQGIDLASLARSLGPAAAPARLHDKAPGPPRVRYVQPPLAIEGAHLGVTEVDGFRARFKFYDYGVISVVLSRPFSGSWSDLVRVGQDHIESEPLEEHAATACQRVVDRVRPFLTDVRPSFLSEDYLAFVVTGVDPPASADHIAEQHGAEIAQLLRGERLPLSRQEQEEVLRHRLSYLRDDLVIPAWNAAFVYDTEVASLATLEILESVNAQLLEFRYHDELLEFELIRIYAELQQPRRAERLIGRRSARAIRRLHALFIDVNELTDRVENSVKLVGDVYSARLFTLAAARLGLDGWKRNVQEKLKTLDDIFRFSVEQTGIAQGNVLELVIILLIVVELALFVAGITK